MRNHLLIYGFLPACVSFFVPLCVHLTATVSTARVCACRDGVAGILGVVCGAEALLAGGSLHLTLFENLLDDVDVLVGVEVVVELLLGWVAHDALSALTGVEDLERVDDVREWDRLVAALPLLVHVGVGDDDLVEV